MLALVLALGATPLAVYAEEGEGTTQSETSNVNEVSGGASETKPLEKGRFVSRRMQALLKLMIMLIMLTSLEKL